MNAPVLTRPTIAMRLLLACLAAQALLAAPAQADRKSAVKHYNAATKAYNLGRFEEAIVSYEKAYEEDPAPILLFNIAQAHRKLEHHDRALFFYRRYLEAAPDAKNRADVETRMAEAQSALDRDKRLAPPPPPVATTQPSVPPAPLPDPAVAGEASTAPNGVPDATVTASPVDEGAPRRTHGLRTAAFVAGGVGVAGLVTGAVFGSMAASAGDEQSKAPMFDRDADQAGKTKETLQYVFYGVGGAALATAVVLYVLDLRQPSERVALVPVVTAQSTGLAARMAF